MRLLHDGVVVILPIDTKKSTRDAYLGCKAEPKVIEVELMGTKDRPPGSHGSGSKGRTRKVVPRLADPAERAIKHDQLTAELAGRNTSPLTDEQISALNAAHEAASHGGRPRLGTERRIRVSGRAEPKHLETLAEAGVQVSTVIGAAIEEYAQRILAKMAGMAREAEEREKESDCSDGLRHSSDETVRFLYSEPAV